MVQLSADDNHSDSPRLQTRWSTHQQLWKWTPAPFCCCCCVSNSVCPPLGDNICATLLWPKLNNSTEFVLFFFVLKLLLAVLTVHAITPSWLTLSPPLSISLSLSQVKSLLDYIFWLHKMRLRGTLDICAWPAFQRWLSEQKWQVNCWFLFRKRERASLPWAL